MIILGALLGVSGAIVLCFARTLHTGWRDMLRSMRAAGVRNTLPGTEFMASDRGYVWMRRVGGAGIAVGVAMLVLGAVRAATG